METLKAIKDNVFSLVFSLNEGPGQLHEPRSPEKKPPPCRPLDLVTV